MGDLKPFWPGDDLPLGTVGLGSDLAISTGSDPNADNGDKPAGIINFWENSKQPLSEQGVSTEESRNSVSGLPALPNRFAPAASGVEVPNLTDRRPGTIDER